jgi:hypothetical protein
MVKDLGGTFDQATGYTPVGQCANGNTNQNGQCANGLSHAGAGSCIAGRLNTGGGGCIGGGNNKIP